MSIATQTADWKFFRTAPDVPMEVYIFVHTSSGQRIATARDTIPALRSNHGLTLTDWYRLEAFKTGMTIESGGWHDKPVKARILYGRWLVDCPVCRGAMFWRLRTIPVRCCTSSIRRRNRSRTGRSALG